MHTEREGSILGAIGLLLRLIDGWFELDRVSGRPSYGQMGHLRTLHDSGLPVDQHAHEQIEHGSI